MKTMEPACVAGQQNGGTGRRGRENRFSEPKTQRFSVVRRAAADLHASLVAADYPAFQNPRNAARNRPVLPPAASRPTSPFLVHFWSVPPSGHAMSPAPLPPMVGRSLAGMMGMMGMAGTAGLLLMLVVFLIGWGGFEIHDEAVESAAPRAVRLTSPMPDQGNAIEYVEGYEAGLRRAAAENRPLLVVFRAGWCHWCAEFAQGTLVDRRLVGLSRQFVCVMVDADRQAADCRRFGVKEFPTVVVATVAEGECRRWKGCPSADELLSAMADALPAARMAATEDDTAATR